MSIEGMDKMGRDQFKGASARIFTTDADHPMSGRIFVWTKAGWFERIEGPWGDVVFEPVAESEDELKNWISKDNPDFDLVEISGKDRQMIHDEFAENAEEALYPEAPENSSEEPFEEQDTT